MLKKATIIATMLVLLTILAVPLVLAQQEDRYFDSEIESGDQRMITNINCDEAFRALEQPSLSNFKPGEAEESARVCIENGILPRVSANDSGFSQYQPALEVCMRPWQLGDAPAPKGLSPCDVGLDEPTVVY